MILSIMLVIQICLYEGLHQEKQQGRQCCNNDLTILALVSASTNQTIYWEISQRPKKAEVPVLRRERQR